MRILIACEFSGVVREAFRRRGHDVWSCDFLPTEVPGPHIQGDVLEAIISQGPWDMMVAHPPCTYLSSSGLHWNARRPERQAQTEAALKFVSDLLNAPVPRIALENPVGCISSRIRKPDQIVQPWFFDDEESKTTCLWLKGLPPLMSTMIVPRRRYLNQCPSGQNKLGPSPDRWKIRSRTYPGLARAMAEQWLEEVSTHAALL
jgi:hypothetical protein